MSNKKLHVLALCALIMLVVSCQCMVHATITAKDSATFPHLFEGDSTMRWIAFWFTPLSMFTGLFGTYRYLRTKNKLKVFEGIQPEATEPQA